MCGSLQCIIHSALLRNFALKFNFGDNTIIKITSTTWNNSLKRRCTKVIGRILVFLKWKPKMKYPYNMRYIFTYPRHKWHKWQLQEAMYLKWLHQRLFFQRLKEQWRECDSYHPVLWLKHSHEYAQRWRYFWTIDWVRSHLRRVDVSFSTKSIFKVYRTYLPME